MLKLTFNKISFYERKLIQKKPIRIAMIAGELSGDLLGAGVIRELKKHIENVEFVGVGGPKMLAEGFNSLFNISELSVMGVGDVLRRYPKLYILRHRLLKEWIANPPDVFIGIDYPDFNLSVETRLKQRTIKTIQLVSPKVWAWRQKRVFSIKKAVDLVLTLFPFEADFYQKYNVPATFIGHPLADLIELNPDTATLRTKYNYQRDDLILAVLPGSRAGEIKHIGPLFLDVMHKLSIDFPHLHFIVPMASPELHSVFLKQVQTKYSHLNIRMIRENAREAMAIANVVLTKSGTATLEAMLLKRPMVVAFKWGTITHSIIAPQLKVPYVSLPNLLVGKKLVPEFFQHNAKAACVAEAVSRLLDSPNQDNIKEQFTAIHHALRQNANEKAARSILKILEPSSI